MSAAERILVTGATGFLGREIVATLLAERPDARLVLLVRGDGPEVAASRVARLLGLDPTAPVEILSADVTTDRCGLGARDYEAAIDGVTHVIHGAATVRFDDPYRDARRINVEGTRRVLELAEAAARRGRFQSFTHISTAFVAGSRRGLAREDELDVGQRFRNTYEKTKCEAETLVRRHMDRVPIRIARPSIIVGSSVTGSTSSFKMLYWPIRVYANGRWRIAPGYGDIVVDLIPVDYVARAVIRLAFDERATGGTFHLCAGPEGSATAGQIGAFASEFFHQPPPRFMNPLLFRWVVRPLALLVLPKRRARVLRDGHVYFPYFQMRTAFDTTAARRLLEPAPKVMDYLERVFRYCLESDWGRRPVPPQP